MRRVAAEALVGASRDEVWDIYDDIEGTPGWMPGLQEILYVSGPARLGTVYRSRSRTALIPSTAQWEIVEYRRPVRQVHVSMAGALETLHVVTFEARGSGTWIRQVTEVSSSLWGPIGMLHELVAVFPAGRNVRSAVAAAKRRFEGSPRR